MSDEEQRDVFTRTYFDRKRVRVELAAVEAELRSKGKQLRMIADLLVDPPEMSPLVSLVAEMPTRDQLLKLLDDQKRLKAEESELDNLVKRMEADG